jgi:hypothetical protein
MDVHFDPATLRMVHENINTKPLKFDDSKVRLELIPPELLIGIGKVLTFGAQKYSAGNWSSGDGFEWSRLYGAMLRHMTAWASGEETDPESGLSHLYHAGCMLAFLIAHVDRRHGKDDRTSTGVRSRSVDASNSTKGNGNGKDQ